MIMKTHQALRLLIRNEVNRALNEAKKKAPLPPLPPIASTPQFDDEMRDISMMHDLGYDVESMLGTDMFGSGEYPEGDQLARKSRYSDPEDLYRKPSAQWMAQHLAASADPEKRKIGQRLLQKMRARLGDASFLRLGDSGGDV